MRLSCKVHMYCNFNQSPRFHPRMSSGLADNALLVQREVRAELDRVGSLVG